jgi:hypothetical protein
MDEDELDAATGVASLTPTSEGPPSIDSLGATSRRFLEHLQSATDALGAAAAAGGGGQGGGGANARGVLGQSGDRLMHSLNAAAAHAGTAGIAAALASSGGYPNLAVPGVLGLSGDGRSPNGVGAGGLLFGGMTGMTPTGGMLSFGGLPSPGSTGGLPADLGSMDLPSPVARALRDGAADGAGQPAGSRLAPNKDKDKPNDAETTTEANGAPGSKEPSLGGGGGGGGGGFKLRKELSVEIPRNELADIEVVRGGAGPGDDADGPGAIANDGEEEEEEERGASDDAKENEKEKEKEKERLVPRRDGSFSLGGGGRRRGGGRSAEPESPAALGEKPAAVAPGGTKRTRSASLSEPASKRSTRSRRGE